MLVIVVVLLCTLLVCWCRSSIVIYTRVLADLELVSILKLELDLFSCLLVTRLGLKLVYNTLIGDGLSRSISSAESAKA